MKKLLSILSAFMLTATASTPVVGCSLGKHVDESIDAAIEQQNFNVIADLGTKYVGKSILDNSNINEAGLFYSNGLTDDNKFIDNRDNTTKGSLGSTKWSFIDMLNDKFDLGLKKNAKVKDNPDLSKVTKQSDLKQFIDYNVDNFNKLGKVTVGKPTGSYQENGSSPVTDKTKPGTTELATSAFNKIINIGNSMSTFWEENGSKLNSLDNSNWQEELNFINGSTTDWKLSDNRQFVDRTYTKQTPFTYNDGGVERKFTFTELIMLKNTETLNGYDKKTQTPENSFIAEQVGKVKKAYDTLTGKNPSPIWNKLSFNVVMNLIFSQMNVFTAQKQDYSVSIELDCNNLKSQLSKAVTNMNQIINDYINQNNEKILSNVFIKKSNEINKAIPDTKDKLSINLDSDDSGKGNDPVDPTKITTEAFSKGFKYMPRVGQKVGDIIGSPNSEFKKEVAARISKIATSDLHTVDVYSTEVSVVVQSKDGTSITDDKALLDTGDKVIITPATGVTKFSGEADLNVDTNNLYSDLSDSDLKDLILVGVDATPLRDGDFLYSKMGLKSVNPVGKTDPVKEFFDNLWIDNSLDNNPHIYTPKGKIFNIENKAISSNDAPTILKQMKDNLNSIVFTTKLNVEDTNEVDFNIIASDCNHQSLGTITYQTKKIKLDNLQISK